MFWNILWGVWSAVSKPAVTHPRPCSSGAETPPALGCRIPKGQRPAWKGCKSGQWKGFRTSSGCQCRSFHQKVPMWSQEDPQSALCRHYLEAEYNTLFTFTGSSWGAQSCRFVRSPRKDVRTKSACLCLGLRTPIFDPFLINCIEMREISTIVKTHQKSVILRNCCL